MPHRDRPRELLEAVIPVVGERGFADLTLRQLADAVGTSHRMLIHHFGSREGLWAAIVAEVERQQLELFRQFRGGTDASAADTIRGWWKHVSDPALWPNERLFFEIYAQALQGRSPAVRLLDTLVYSWVDIATARAVSLGVAPEHAQASARLGLATTRGLLLDLLATGDVDGVDAAMDEWIRLFQTRGDRAQHGPAPCRSGAVTG